MPYLSFSHMLPSFTTSRLESIDDFEIVSLPDDHSEYGVESFTSDETIESRSDICYDGLTLSMFEHGPSYHYDSTILAKPWDVADTLEEQAEIEHCSLTRPAINTMALAGRGDARHTFKDMRSGRRSRRRQHAAAEKYYGYRYVSHGAIKSARDGALPKKEVFEAAQEWPRPPKHSRRSNLKDVWPWQSKFEARLMDARYRHLDCREPDLIWDISEHDLECIRWELAMPCTDKEPEVPQLPLFDFVKGGLTDGGG